MIDPQTRSDQKYLKVRGISHYSPSPWRTIEATTHSPPRKLMHLSYRGISYQTSTSASVPATQSPL
ncbi:MAG TPA: hypothetical protein V6D27_13485, partial [Vampirovibrionales bacterium]